MNDALPIEVWDIDKIIPYEKNAKIHNEVQVDKLVTSILKFGWTQPIVVDKDGIVIAGHGRRLAAIKMGKTKVPVLCRRDLNKSEANALRLADNRVTSVEYDMTMIQEELILLAEDGFDLNTIGFDQNELTFSLANLGEMDTDFFVDNVSDAVEAQKNNNKRVTEEVDDTAAPVTDALGFKRVSIAQSRVIKDLMVRIEQKTGRAGPDALIDFISTHI